MRRLFGWLSLLLLMSLAVQAAVTIDLSQLGRLPSKGRVQDQECLPPSSVVSALIAAGPEAIPFLVARLTDETEVNASVSDFWPRLRVGDVALVIISDLFTLPDGTRTTVPGLDWDSLLGRADADTPAWALLERYIAAHGRPGLQSKVKEVFAPYLGQLAWNDCQRCFRPVTDVPPKNATPPVASAR